MVPRHESVDRPRNGIRSAYRRVRYKWLTSYRLNRLRKRVFRRLRPTDQSRLIFVFGAQRSGTTVLSRAFGLSPRVWVYGEGDPPFFHDDQGEHYLRLKPFDEIEALLRAERSPYTLVKPLFDSQHHANLLQRFTGSKGLWIYRNVDDVVNSHEDYYTAHDGVTYIRRMMDFDNRSWMNERLPPEIEALLRRYAETEFNSATGYALFWLARTALYPTVADLDELLLVNYEALVTEPYEELARIFAFVGVPFKKRYAEIFHRQSVSKKTPPPIDDAVRAECVSLWERLQAAGRESQTRS